MLLALQFLSVNSTALSGKRVQGLRGITEQHDIRHRRLRAEELKVDGLLNIL